MCIGLGVDEEHSCLNSGVLCPTALHVLPVASVPNPDDVSLSEPIAAELESSMEEDHPESVRPPAVQILDKPTLK